MEINSEKIARLNELTDELEVLEGEATEAINLAKVNKDRKAKVERNDGSVQDVTEGMLWDELWTLGPNSEAGVALRKLYPEAFQKSEKHAEKAREINLFTLSELGISSSAIKIRDIVNLVEALVDFKSKEK
jgi:hypothetical protein